MPDASEFLCPRCNVSLDEVRTSGGVFLRTFGEKPTTNLECSDDEIRMKSVCYFVLSI